MTVPLRAPARDYTNPDLEHVPFRLTVTNPHHSWGPVLAAVHLPPAAGEHPAWAVIFQQDCDLFPAPGDRAFNFGIIVHPFDGVPYLRTLLGNMDWQEAMSELAERVRSAV